MSDPIDDTKYLDLLTSAWRNKPNFTAMISSDVATAVQVQNLLFSMIPIFDLDVAVGQQLDFIGQWVGISRQVSIPISGVYFSWDGIDYTLGWDFGSWQPPGQPTQVTSLPDDAYRTLIRSKIAANNWDGTTNGAYAIWEVLFPTITILIQDHQDMSYDLIVIGAIIDSITLALIVGGYIPLRPEGVLVSEYLVSVDSNKAFSWDLENDLLGGWDEASWLREISPT